MTNTTNPATELDIELLDLAVGGASTVVVHDARKQEQSDKLNIIVHEGK